MSDFTIRVVLHDNATWDEYSKLRADLASQGVVDYIKSDDGRWWRLPPAEYTYSGAQAINVVREAVYQVAGNIKPRRAVFVTETSNRSWIGLEVLSGPG